jgi:hypothetical protein
MNQALILMAAWRIAEQPNDFLHSVLKSKYFPNSSVWRPNSNAPKSAFWASILKMLPILKTHSFYQITKGHMSIWSTPWCNDWANLYDTLIIQPSNYSYPAQVKDLWLPNEQTWNTQLIDTLFQNPTAEIIKSTRRMKTCFAGNSLPQVNATLKVHIRLVFKICRKMVSRSQEK